MTFFLSTDSGKSIGPYNLSERQEHGKVSISYNDMVCTKFEESSAYLEGELHDSCGGEIGDQEIDWFQEPESILDHVDGQFLLVSITDDSFKVIRDFFGLKPVYYTEEDGELYIADKISYLLPFIDVEVNRGICRDYLRKGFVDHTRDTFFSGIKRLQPREGLIFDGDNLEVFKPDYSVDTKVEIKKLLETEVERKISGNSFACPVSGGLDSAILAAKSAEADTEFFHISFDAKTGDEEYYEILRQYLKLNVTELDQKISELVKNTDNLVKIQEEPVSMISSGAQASLYKEISQSSDETSVLDGIGADELFYGYPMFLPFYVTDCFRESFLTGLHAVKDFLPELGFTGVKKVLKLAVSGESLADAREKHLREFYFPHMLRFTAKNADYYGLRVIPVFLSKKLAYKSQQIPSERNFAGGNSKMILRDAFREVLPPELYDRSEKTGFIHTSDELFRPEVWSTLDKVFSSKRFQERKFFDGELFYQEFRNGVRNFAQCYRYYCFEMWLREFIDQ